MKYIAKDTGIHYVVYPEGVIFEHINQSSVVFYHFDIYELAGFLIMTELDISVDIGIDFTNIVNL